MNAVLAAIVVVIPLTIASAVASAEPLNTQQSELSGRVLHADLPVPGATVKATGAERTVTTSSDADGVFRFANLDAGAWTIEVEMRGFVAITREVTIPPGPGPLVVSLTMRPYAEIVGSGTSLSAWPGLSVPAPGAETKTADGPEILTGSVVNGAATPFAQPRAIGNNRPRPAPPYSGAFTAALGDSAWDARPYSFGGPPPPSPDYGNAQLGLTFGGPLRIPFLLRNGPMMQVNVQHGVQHTANMQSALMPTLAEREGDLSGYAGVIRDPLTGEPFTDNRIPAERIVPQATALLGLYPRPTGATSTGANFLRPVLSGTTTDSVQVRASSNVGARTILSGTFAYQRTVTDTVNLFDFTDTSRQSSITAGVAWTRRFGTRLNVRANYQFTSADSTLTPFFANRINVSGDAGITGNDQHPLNWGPPTIAFPDIADLRDGNYQRSTRISHLIGAEAQLRRGRHQITFGADARLHRSEILTQSDPRGTLTFTGAATGSAFADFLLGIPKTSAIGVSHEHARLLGGVYDAYVNDSFRVAPGLTLEMGVRWEYESPYAERDGRLANLDVVPGFGAVATVVGSDPVGALTGAAYPPSLIQSDRRGFQPRLGISWRPWLTSSLVIRGGYGLYRNLGVYQSIGTLLAQQPPFSTTFSVQNSVENPLSLANPFPATIPSSTTFAADPDYRTAQLHSWQLTVQRDLPASLTVLVAYFADRGTHLTQAFLPNTYAPGASNPCSSCPSGFTYLTSGGASTRNAGQVTLRRRLYAGFMASISYTLAKSTDNAATFSSTTVSPGSLSVAQDWLDLNAERGPSSFDQRHLMSVDMQYTTGVGIRGGTLVDSIWGTLYKDWTVTAQFSTGSGMPVTPVFFAAVPGSGVVGIRPSLTGQPIATNQTGSYANPAAFMAPAPGTWGDAGRNSIRGPSTYSFDMSVARAFRLRRRMTLEWRLAATNLLNRVMFTAIDRITTSPQFGQPTSANQMRRIQMLFRFGF